MEECDAISEDTNQPRASPNQNQQPPQFSSLDDFLKKISDDLVPPPVNDAEVKQGEKDDTDDSQRVADVADGSPKVTDRIGGTQGVLDDVSNSPGPSSWSPPTRKLFHASLEPIVEGMAASSLDLQLAETTPSMIAMTSRTSVDSLASGQSASMQTIFRTPDWADDDSDNKLSEKIVLPSRGLKLSRIVDEEQEAVVSMEDVQQSLATTSVDGGGPSTEEWLGGSESLMESTVQNAPGNDGNLSGIELNEQVSVDLRDFDPLSAPVLLSPTQDDEVVECNRDDECRDVSTLGLVEPVVLENPELSESQKSASAAHGGDDLIQFDNQYEEFPVAEEQPPVQKFDPQPMPFPIPTIYVGMMVEDKSEPFAETPDGKMEVPALKHPGLADFKHCLNQLKEHRDLSLAKNLMSTNEEDGSDKERPRLPIDELDKTLKNILRSKTLAPCSPNSDVKEGDVEASVRDDTKEEVLSQPGANEIPPEHVPPSSEPESRLQNVGTPRQERFDLISFDSTEEVAIVAPQAAVNEMATAEPKCSENMNIDPENTKTEASQSEEPKDEFEIELIKTSSEIHQIRLSSSELLQDFYDMRKTYAGEFSLGSKSVARTVAERDVAGTELDQQSQRIDSAIDLMDATIDEIQRWQTKTRRTIAERDTGSQDKPIVGEVVASKKPVEKNEKLPEVVRSSTVPSVPAPTRGRLPNKPAHGTAAKREVRTARADTSRPMTSNLPTRNQNVSGRSTAPPRREALVSQEKRSFGDAKAPFIAGSRRVQPIRPNINVPATRLQKSTTPAKSARTLQTPEEKLTELKKCTASPASYLERCLAISQVEVAGAKRPVPQKENVKPAPAIGRATTQTPNKASKPDPNVKEPLPPTPAKGSNIQKVIEKKEILVPQKLVESSKKDTNLPRAATDAPPVVKDGEQESLKRKNRFLSDEDIEKWVRLSTRYARCAEMGASLFTSKHSCEGDKESVKSDGSLVKTASDVLMDTLMDTVTSAVKKTSRSKKMAAKASKQPTVVAAKDILNRLSVGDTTCITQLKTEEKVTRSINNLVRSMSKIVDSTSDNRVCWDSSLDSLPTSPAERDGGLDDVQEEIVEKSRQVVERMTDTLIKHLGNRPDELDFKVTDDIEPVTQMSMENVTATDLSRAGSAQKSRESLKRWSDTKSTQLEVILSRLMQTNSSTSSWGLTSHDADVVPDSVRSSRHKLATLENIVALLNGIDRTCKNRENNVEWDDPVDAPRPPSMAPLPDRSKRAQKGSQGDARRKSTRKDKARRKAGSLSNLSLRMSSKGGGKTQERLSYCNTCDEKLRRPTPPPKTHPRSTAGSRHSKATKDSGKGSPSTRTLHSRTSASSSDNGGSRRSSHCMACVEKKKQAKAWEREARRRRRSLSNASAQSQASKASASKERDAPKKPRLSYCDTCDRKLKKEKRAKERGETTPKTPRRSVSVSSERRERSQSPTMRRGSSVSSASSNVDGSSSKSHRFSYCDTCDEKRRKEALAKERGETTPQTPRRSASVSSERRERSQSPVIRRGSSLSSGSSKSHRFSYCDTCDEKRRKEALAKERGEITPQTPRRSASVSSERRERSQSPVIRRGSSLSSGSSNVNGSSSKSQRFSYCDTCDEKRRKEALAKERGETTPPNPPVRDSSPRSRSRSPLARPESSISSNSSVEGGASKKPRYSYCDTCDEKLRNQTPPATPLRDRSRATIASWRSDSSQDIVDHAMPKPRVSFSAPLEFFERDAERPSSPQRQSVGGATPSPTKERRSQPALRPPSPPTKVHDLRKTDSLLSNLSASLSRDSTSDNYSSATFIIADRPSRPRVDLALPKIRHVEGTRSTYKHVLQKAFMDRLDNIIKVQSASSHVNLSPEPTAPSATSLTRYTRKKPERSNSDKHNARQHIPTATEIRARMRRCCERMPSRDIFGVEISRESLARPSRQRAAESVHSFGSLDDVLNMEDLEQSSVSTIVGNRAFSATYASLIQREKPFAASTKISRKIQSFIKHDLRSWDKLTNDCIQNVKEVNILPITVAPVTGNALRNITHRFNKSDEDLLLALITALSGSPRTKPSLLATSEPEDVVLGTERARKKNKVYRQRDNLDQDEVVIPIDDFCSSETLLRTLHVALKTDTEASRSAEIESPTSSTDFEAEHVDSECNLEQVLKSVTVLSYPPSVRNMEIDSTGSSTDFENSATTGSMSQGQQVLENVAQFSYVPQGKDSDTSTAASVSENEEVETSRSNEVEGVFQKADESVESCDAEIVETPQGELEVISTPECCAETSEGDKPSAENADGQKNGGTANDDSCTPPITADSNLKVPIESSHSSENHLFSLTTEESSESLQKMTSCSLKESTEESFSSRKGDLPNSSTFDSNESYCSIPEMLERLEMAIPFQHERFAIETNSGISIPIVDAVTEDTWDKLTHAITHLPQETINTGDEIYSRHHHPNLPLDVRADMELYNECQDDEFFLYQNQKTANRGVTRGGRDGVRGVRQTKSLLSENVHETKVSEEPRRWSDGTDGIEAASGDTDFLNSDGVSLIANVSTEVCVTDSVADQSLLNISSSSIFTPPNSSVSTSTESLPTVPEDAVVSTENEILLSLLDQVNTPSQLIALNSRLDGVVRREQLVEEVVEPRVVQWRGTGTISALCVTFGAVVVGAVLGIPSLWE